MNARWLYRNMRNFWPVRGSAMDFARSMFWIYSRRIRKTIASEYTIRFKYPAPVGEVRLLLRCNAGSDAFIHGEVFGHQYYWLGLDSSPSTILDLGANTGLTATYFSKLYPQARLACVEPVPENLRVLRSNLAMNNVHAQVVAAAVDVEDGMVQMELSAKDYGHKVAGGSVPERDTVRVEAVSMPTLLKRLQWDRVGLLKMDIEGHEKALFAGNCDWLNQVDAMCIECHDDFGEPDLQSLALRFGFAPPKRLPGIWLMTRQALTASAAGQGK